MRSRDWIYLAQDRDRWRSCECGNEPLGPIKFGNFVELTGDLLACQEGVSSMELVSWSVVWLAR